MATARIETALPEPPPKKVILELSEQEARAVYAACGNTSGDGAGLLEYVYIALRDAGINHHPYWIEQPLRWRHKT